MCLSLDQAHLVSGDTLGHVHVWDLKLRLRTKSLSLGHRKCARARALSHHATCAGIVFLRVTLCPPYLNQPPPAYLGIQPPTIQPFQRTAPATTDALMLPCATSAQDYRQLVRRMQKDAPAHDDSGAPGDADAQSTGTGAPRATYDQLVDQIMDF